MNSKKDRQYHVVDGANATFSPDGTAPTVHHRHCRDHDTQRLKVFAFGNNSKYTITKTFDCNSTPTSADGWKTFVMSNVKRRPRASKLAIESVLVETNIACSRNTTILHSPYVLTKESGRGLLKRDHIIDNVTWRLPVRRLSVNDEETDEVHDDSNERSDVEVTGVVNDGAFSLDLTTIEMTNRLRFTLSDLCKRCTKALDANKTTDDIVSEFLRKNNISFLE